VQIEEMATPVVALGVDGAWYDVAELEAIWGIKPSISSTEFHTRVVAARCVGLFELDARLRAGPRPAAARIRIEDMLPLPPCDTDGAALFQLEPYSEESAEPRFWRADVRTLVGHGQPVAQPHGHQPTAQVGLAVLLSDDLWRASAREAARAIAGVTLQLDWGPGGPSTLGEALVVGRSLRDVGALSLSVRTNDGEIVVPAGAWRFRPAESIAFISQSAPLRAGDVVGLGGALPAPLSVAIGERVTAKLAPLLRLQGWPTAGPPPVAWRL
jgi:hypothetical protein